MTVFALVPASRRPEVSRVVVVVGALWALVAAVATWIERAYALPTPVCAFRNLTGVPCPTCGATRGVFAALDGRWLDAVLFNPLVVVVGTAIVVALALRVLFRRRVVVALPPRARVLAWGAAGVLFVANWAWLIARDL